MNPVAGPKASLSLLLASCLAVLADFEEIVVHRFPTDRQVDNPGAQPITVVCDTTKGTFDVEVHSEWAPLGAKRYLELVETNFWSGITFFRYNKWITQFGACFKDRHGDFESIRNQPITDDPACKREGPADRPTALVCGVPRSEGIMFDGAVSYAGGGANTRTSQIFIVHNLADQPIGTDSEWEVPFGNVTRGLDVVRSLYSEYGERPDQTAIWQEGDAYIEREFPLLDHIKSCHVLPPPAGTAFTSNVVPTSNVPPIVSTTTSTEESRLNAISRTASNTEATQEEEVFKMNALGGVEQ
ncbi:hypothetical protein CYMTET_11891 [Cymbomonas tetramitiformis]|uniref:peptidylprolyl isomerase n=1 Tax=Cymbomonas tetramitiformis TaxID=36881 RepID=A0AAE0LD08_9CHLO|nr:hypothetical protein CYMTET_11891 [Cymbomonas tetramitiformis]